MFPLETKLIRICIHTFSVNGARKSVHQQTYHLKTFSVILEKQCYGSVIRMLSTSDLIWFNSCNGDTFVCMTVNYCSYDCKLD